MQNIQVLCGKIDGYCCPAMFVAQTIGRVGDVINGEHWSRALDTFWGWYFTHPDSPARLEQRFFGDQRDLCILR